MKTKQKKPASKAKLHKPCRVKSNVKAGEDRGHVGQFNFIIEIEGLTA